MTITIPKEGVTRLVNFIKARERHRDAREAGSWQSGKRDPIITKYRFCNVRREDDRVTKEIFQFAFETMGWRTDAELWFAFVVARLFNNEETLLAISDNILPFKPLPMARILKTRAAAGHKNFNAAYIVSTNGRAMNKIDYVIDFILTPLWKQRAHLSHLINKQELLQVVHALLEEQNGLGSFMAGQVIADLKYAEPGRWSDFATFAVSGPGSKRGMNVVLGNQPDAPLPEGQFRATLARLRDSVNAKLNMPALEAHNVQNCLCEYSKYWKVETGVGEPKQLYKPKE